MPSNHGFRFTSRSSSAAPAPAPTVSLTQQKQKGTLFGFAFCLIFFLIGAAVFYFLTIRPVSKILAARSWPAVPCRIISAEVKMHPGDKGGATYSVNISYEYTVKGATFRSDRYDFFGGSSSGYKSKQAVINRYRADPNPTCYVDPSHPQSAVLVRDLTANAWIAVLPIVFMLLGGGGMLLVRRQARKGPAAVSALQPSRPMARRSTAGGPVSLKPQQSTIGQVLVVAAFAAFWNGIVSIFVVHAVRDWGSGGAFSYFFALFLVPFVIVGLVLIGAIFYTFLKIFNPQIVLTLSSDQFALGDTATVNWNFTGRYDRVERLVLSLEAREEATYRRGTDTRTDTHVFYTHELFNSVKQVEIARSSLKFTIPADSMHSLNGVNNKIIWCLQVHGDIPKWPDVKEEFRLDVRPAIQTHSVEHV